MDRHARLARADGDRRRRPPQGYRTRDARRFAELVSRAIGLLPQELETPARKARLCIVAVSAAWTADDPVLATYEAGDAPRLTVYRRPLEARAVSRTHLEGSIASAVGDAIASTLGLDHWDEEDW